MSGLILLFEGSLRVGDYIELDSGLRGTVKEINTRATVINTNDSVDMVVPNSEFVTSRLTNWTLRDPVGRLRPEAYAPDEEFRPLKHPPRLPTLDDTVEGIGP